MAPHEMPSFRPLDLAKSSNRLACSQWRTFVAVLDTDGSSEATGVLTRVQETFNNKLTPRERGRFTVVTRESLVEHAKRRKIGASKLPEALVDLVAQEKVEGLAAKKRLQLQSRSGRDDELSATDDSTNATPDAARQKLELRAAVLCGAENNADSAPDRIYLLIGFPANESEAAQLLEHGVTTAAKLSAAASLFDAVVQLTAHTAASTAGASTAEHSAASSAVAASSATTVTQQLTAAQSRAGTQWQDIVFKAISVTHSPATTLPQSTLEQGHNVLAGSTVAVQAAGDGSSESAAAAAAPQGLKEFTALIAEFSSTVTQLAASKCDFTQWFQTVDLVQLPRTRSTSSSGSSAPFCLAQAARDAAAAADSTAVNTSTKESLWRTEPCLKHYSQLMDSVPQLLHSPAVVLQCMLEATLTTANATSSSKPLNLFTALAQQQQPAVSSMLVLDDGDTTGLRAATAEAHSVLAGAARPDARPLILAERAMLRSLQHPRLSGPGALPLKPPRCASVLGRESTELLTFTPLGRTEIDAQRRVWAFESMLASHADGITAKAALAAKLSGSSSDNKQQQQQQQHDWQLQRRAAHCAVPAHVLPQLLSAANAAEPVYLKRYYEPADQLLLAVHRPTPQGRAEQLQWCPQQSSRLACRVAFSEWAAAAAAVRDPSYTPRTLSALGAVMDVSQKELSRLRQVRALDCVCCVACYCLLLLVLVLVLLVAELIVLLSRKDCL
jgi:hypothetical protein